MSLKTAIKKPALTHDAICIQTQNEITHGDWNWVNDKKQTENLDPGNPANYYESTLSPGKTSHRLSRTKSVNW